MNKLGSSEGRVSARRWSRRFGATASMASVVSMVSVVAVLAASPVSASPSAPGSAVVAAAPLAAGAQLVSFDQQMIRLVNQARAAAKVPPLTEATGLTRLALWWSSQESDGANDYRLAHNTNAWTMLTQSPYGASNRTTWGENVAWSSSNASTAQQIFTAYMNSPGHRANILSKNYHYIGMGSASGSHGLFNTTEFTDAVQPGQAVAPPVIKPAPPVVKPAPPVVKPAPPVVKPAPPVVKPRSPVVAPTPIRKLANGTFIRDTSNNAVYRVAGGAPLYVSSFRALFGHRTVINVPHAQIAAMRKVPADGTFIRTTGNNSVYRIAGGAPIAVITFAPFGGSRPTVTVDAAVVANSGAAGRWAHLNKYPVTTTYLQASGTTKIYKVVRGKVSLLSSWASVGGRKLTIPVDPRAIAKAGQPGRYSHLKR